MDTCTGTIAQIIEAEREDREPPAVPEPEKPVQGVGLMAALQGSVTEARASRGEDADVHERPKKNAAKKQPAGPRPGRCSVAWRWVRRSKASGGCLRRWGFGVRAPVPDPLDVLE
jgi:DNA end-binding protein Ku